MPDALTTINASAFNGPALTSVVIPNTVTKIDSSAFKNCTALTSIVLPNGLTAINGSVFAGCSALTSIVLPETVTSIGANAFDGCTTLASINIPEAVVSIGTSAFAGCTSIVEIIIPATTSVGETAFNGWTAEQTIKAFVSEYETAKIWTFGWNVGSAANRVFNYTPTV